MVTSIASHLERSLSQNSPNNMITNNLFALVALRQKLIREKAIVDQQLKIGVQNQMEETKEALDILGTTKEQVLGVRANMKNIDSLCKDTQGLITDYPRIRKVTAYTHLLSLALSDIRTCWLCCSSMYQVCS